MDSARRKVVADSDSSAFCRTELITIIKSFIMCTPGPRYPRKMSVQLLMTFEQLMSGVVRSWTYKLIRLFYNAFF
jgi:hypothetical protein